MLCQSSKWLGKSEYNLTYLATSVSTSYDTAILITSVIKIRVDIVYSTRIAERGEFLRTTPIVSNAEGIVNTQFTTPVVPLLSSVATPVNR